MHAYEDDRSRCDLCDDDRPRMGRPVRRREVGARQRQRVPAHDDPLRRSSAALADRARSGGGALCAPARRPRSPSLLARLARVRGLQPARVHRARARAAAERLSDCRARAVTDGSRSLATVPCPPVCVHPRTARCRPRRSRARDQRWPSVLDRERLDRLGRRARARRCVQLRALRAGRGGVPGALAASLHGADRVAGLAHGSRGDDDRPRLGTRGGAVRPPDLVGHAADRLPRDPRGLPRGADVERRNRADRPAERRPVRKPHPGHDLRDRDRARLPAHCGRARRCCADDRCARREQRARPQSGQRRRRIAFRSSAAISSTRRRSCSGGSCSACR